LRGPGRRGAEHVRGFGLHGGERAGHRRPAFRPDRAAGPAADRGVEHEPVRRGTVPCAGWGDGRACGAHAPPAPAWRLGGAWSDGRAARADRDAGEQGAGDRVRLRAVEVRPGTGCAADRAGVRIADRGASLLQHVRPAPGAVQPVHGRARDLRFPAPEREPPADLRGWAAAAGFRERTGRGPGVRAGDGRAGRAGPHDQRGERGVAHGPGGRRADGEGGRARGSHAKNHGAISVRRHTTLLRGNYACPKDARLRSPRFAGRGTARAGELAGWPGRARPRCAGERGAGRPGAYRMTGASKRESRPGAPLELMRNGRSDAPVLITGGAGFVGSNLADRLLARGLRVIILDNLSRPGVERNLERLTRKHGESLRVEVPDTRDASAVAAAVADARVVYHFAAQVAVTTSLDAPVHDFEINARGTLNVLEAIRARADPPPLFFTSTNKVYGSLDDIPLRRFGARYVPEDPVLRAYGVGEDRALDFHSPYGCSKGAADQYVLDYARTYRIPAVV